ncbi:MBL fold metallo-hydrolase [Endozoicomonas arenosclerae]|uniref:MBL fold metallo-hydrolase n=1 Tax=Endozoicomonas arenosclerae TaxID=1633495 RepID=UPI0007842653|nr:MBL fold metallo-hydrolase [Endozoicomonas arenosclerae]
MKFLTQLLSTATALVSVAMLSNPAVAQDNTKKADLVPDQQTMSAIHRVPIKVSRISENIHMASGIGNVFLIATSEGNVIFDTGIALQSKQQLDALREAVPGDVKYTILSHSHADHVGGVQFLEGSKVVAHREFNEEQRYLKELEPYLWNRNRTLFPWMPEKPGTVSKKYRYGNVTPDILVDENDFTFNLGGTTFKVLSTPGGEGADNISLWLPEQKTLLTGDLFGPFFPQFPNIFTMRGEKVRKPVEYINSLDRLIALQPEMILPAHFIAIRNKKEIMTGLTKMRDAVQYVHDSVVDGMNAGQTVKQLMADIKLPEALELTQQHGKVSWAVRSIWEYYATWFHFKSTTELYSTPAESVYQDLVELAGTDQLLGKASSYIERGKVTESIHLLDIVLNTEPNHKEGNRLYLKAHEILMQQAKQGLRNDYEMHWLRSQIIKARNVLKNANT